MSKILVIIFLLVNSLITINGWFFGNSYSSVEIQNNKKEVENDGMPGSSDIKGSPPGEVMSPEKKQSTFRHVPFEVKTVDDRLLKEATVASEMSRLDNCYHRVMSELQGSCGSMNEEEISKLSVQLLNCQSSVENRPTFLCTSDMTIGECTKNMDPTLWNSYQIVSNRARAVCYQIRQQQFRLKTELTVNMLVQTSEEQLRALKEMESSQETLRNITEDAMKSVEKAQERLLNKQEDILSSQTSIEAQISENVRTLQMEKLVIVSENEKIIKLAERIQDKLDDTSSKIQLHTDVQTTRHNELMNDISEISTETKNVYKVLGESRTHIKKLKEETSEHLEDVVQNLKLINGSISYVINLVEAGKLVVNEKLETLDLYLKMAGKDINFVSHFLLHVVYFFGALLTLTFFDVRSIFKLLLLLLVILNIGSLSVFDRCLSFMNITCLLAFLLSCKYFTSCFFRQKQNNNKNDNNNNKSPLMNEVLPQDKYATSGLSVPEIQKVILALEKLKSERNHNDNNKQDDPDLANLTQQQSCFGNKSSFFDAALDPGLFKDPIISWDKTTTAGNFLPKNPPPTPTAHPYLGGGAMKDSVFDTPISVKRRLMTSFEPLTPSSRSSRSSSPARMSMSTPKHKSPSRDSTFNRSMRPQCSASTKSGTICKIPCQDGSLYCHVHSHNDEW